MFASRLVSIITGVAQIPALCSTATALSFVTPSTGRQDAYDSILLEDGTRCRFARHPDGDGLSRSCIDHRLPALIMRCREKN